MYSLHPDLAGLGCSLRFRLSSKLLGDAGAVPGGPRVFLEQSVSERLKGGLESQLYHSLSAGALGKLL